MLQTNGPISGQTRKRSAECDAISADISGMSQYHPSDLSYKRKKRVTSAVGNTNVALMNIREANDALLRKITENNNSPGINISDIIPTSPSVAKTQDSIKSALWIVWKICI